MYQGLAKYNKTIHSQRRPLQFLVYLAQRFIRSSGPIMHLIPLSNPIFPSLLMWPKPDDDRDPHDLSVTKSDNMLPYWQKPGFDRAP